MKNIKRILLILIMSLMCMFAFTACEKETNEDTEQVETKSEDDDNGDDDNTETEPVNVTPESKEPDETKMIPVLVHDDVHCFLINDGENAKLIYEAKDGNEFITKTEVIGDYEYIIRHAYDLGGYELLVFDKEGNKTDTPVINTNCAFMSVVEYEGKIYIDCTSYKSSTEDAADEIYVYDPESKKCVHDNKMQELSRKIHNSGYAFLMNENSLMKTLEAFKGDIFAAPSDSSGGVCQFDMDGNKSKNVLKMPNNSYVNAIAGDYIWAVHSDWQNDLYEIMIYNLRTGDYSVMYNGDMSSNPEVTAAAGGKFYGYVCADEYFHPDMTLFEYDPETKETKNLMQASENPGSAGYYYMPFYSGLAATDDSVYYIESNNGKAIWKRFDLNDGKLYDTTAVAHEAGWSDYADVTSEKDLLKFPGTDLICYKYYLEKTTIKDSVEHAAEINKVLSDRYDRLKEGAISDYEGMQSDESWGKDYTYYCSSEWSLSDIKKIGSHYLVIDYTGYDYYGGAHGMEFNEHHLFDLNTGNEVELADLCDMNDDTFKNLIAMKTVANWKEDDSQYYESYEYNPDYANELFDSVREYASKDMAVGFTETGIVVEYTPYQYGPYASGYIYVPVSYEELGIDINK
ncbi:MAG: hypothetical protein J5525_08840 [Lachnospiraceae bacterium]|nr:hypothetical protein [Lachnospiraceae bacterium]